MLFVGLSRSGEQPNKNGTSKKALFKYHSLRVLATYARSHFERGLKTLKTKNRHSKVR